MPDETHTMGRMRIENEFFIYIDKKYAGDIGYGNSDVQDAELSRRICALWNALANVPTDDLERAAAEVGCVNRLATLEDIVGNLLLNAKLNPGERPTLESGTAPVRPAAHADHPRRTF